MRKMPRILLISPTATKPGFISKFFRFPPLNLALLAALATQYDYQIIDENVDGLNFESEGIRGADIIGLTAMTAQAPRAYELADKFRKMAKTVIMGGMHVSALPEEALQHCDAVVVGEAEGIWPIAFCGINSVKMLRTRLNNRISSGVNKYFQSQNRLRYRNLLFPVICYVLLPHQDISRSKESSDFSVRQ